MRLILFMHGVLIFLFGVLFANAIGMALQDHWGLNSYLDKVRQGWIDRPVWVSLAWAVFDVIFVGINIAQIIRVSNLRQRDIKVIINLAPQSPE